VDNKFFDLTSNIIKVCQRRWASPYTPSLSLVPQMLALITHSILTYFMVESNYKNLLHCAFLFLPFQRELAPPICCTSKILHVPFLLSHFLQTFSLIFLCGPALINNKTRIVVPECLFSMLFFQRSYLSQVSIHIPIIASYFNK